MSLQLVFTTDSRFSSPTHSPPPDPMNDCCSFEIFIVQISVHIQVSTRRWDAEHRGCRINHRGNVPGVTEPKPYSHVVYSAQHTKQLPRKGFNSLASKRMLRVPDGSTNEVRLVTHYCMRNDRRLEHRKLRTCLSRFYRARN